MVVGATCRLEALITDSRYLTISYRGGESALDAHKSCDYIGYMIATLRESKAKLSALVELASHGEEVVITVRGKPKARLCPLAEAEPSEARKSIKWARQLKEARNKYSTGIHSTTDDILKNLREDRT